MVELSVLGISLQEEISPVLLLHPIGTRRVLSVAIGPMEAFAISTALHAEEATAKGYTNAAFFSPGKQAAQPLPHFPRPMTHDFLLGIMTALGSRLVSVTILRVVDGAYIAEADIQIDNRQVKVDCRPSDGIALALRCGARIRAAEIVLEHSEDIDQVMAALPEHVRTIATAKLADLALADMDKRKQTMPAAVEQALSIKIRAGENNELVSVARQMLENEARRSEDSREVESFLQDAENRSPKRIKVDAPSPVAKPNVRRAPVVKINGVPVPQIKVAVMRQSIDPEPALKGDLHAPGNDMSDKTLTALGLSRREAEAVLGAPDNDRWAMLLRLLAPETKDLM